MKRNFFRFFTSIPYAIKSIEAGLGKGNGPQKAEAVLSHISDGLKGLNDGQPHTPDQVDAISTHGVQIIDGVVGLLNAFGVFQHS